MKKLLLLFFFTSFFIFFIFSEVKAQACSGTGSSSYTDWECEPDYTGNPVCTDKGSKTVTGSCTLWNGSCQFKVTWEEHCDSGGGSCTVNNQCDGAANCYDPCGGGGGPTPTPGGGNSCEDVDSVLTAGVMYDINHNGAFDDSAYYIKRSGGDACSGLDLSTPISMRLQGSGIDYSAQLHNKCSGGGTHPEVAWQPIKKGSFSGTLTLNNMPGGWRIVALGGRDGSVCSISSANTLTCNDLCFDNYIDILVDWPCNSWVDTYIRGDNGNCSPYTSYQNNLLQCQTSGSDVVLHNNISTANAMRWTNINPPFAGTDCNNFNFSSLAWETRAADKNWSLLSGEGERKVCVQYRHNNPTWATSKCGAMIRTIASSPCPAPGSISGVRQCLGTSSQINWSWGAVTGATQYELQTDRDNTFSNAGGYKRTYTGITTNSYTTINHAYNVGIWARVRATAGTCSSLPGPWRTIGSPVTTLDCDLDPTGVTDCAVPSNFRLTSQTCNANGNIDATWAWNTVSDTNQYKFALWRNDGAVFNSNYFTSGLNMTINNMGIANIDWCGRIRVETNSSCLAPSLFSPFACTSIACPTPLPGQISCSLTANPSSGNAPLNVDLTANVLGGSGNTDYRFDAYSDGTYEAQYLGRSATTLTHNTNYTTAGNRTAKAQVTRSGLTANINVGSGPTNTPTTNPTNTPTPTNIPTSPSCSCTANMTPDPPTAVNVGGTRSFTTAVNNITAGCSVQKVNFVSSKTSVATVSPASDTNGAPYITTATGVSSAGSPTVISSQVIMNDGGVGCSDSLSLSVLGPTSVPATPEPTDPIGCSCGDWIAGACGAGACDTDQRQETRTCAPAGCNPYVTRCFDDSSCVPNTPVPTQGPNCSVNVNFSPGSVGVGQNSVATAQVTASGGSVDRVNFSITGDATLLSTFDTSSPYQASAQADAPGSAIVTADVIMNGVERCFDSATLDISQPSCTVNLLPDTPGPYKISQSVGYTAFVNNIIPAGQLVSVNFSSSNTLVATVIPTTDIAVPYRTIATGKGPGDTNIIARALVNGFECDDDTVVLSIIEPSCNMSLSPDPVEVELGAPRTIYAALNIDAPYTLADASSVNFSTNPGGIVSLNPASDTNPGTPAGGFQTQAMGLALGTTTLQANAIFYGIDTCEDTATVNVINATPWWQVKEGDAIAATGDIKSDIPYACVVSPTCTESFILNDAGDQPGIASFGNSGSIYLGSDGGVISSKLWSASSDYLDPTLYSYAYFENKLPIPPQDFATSSVLGTFFNLGAAIHKGYTLYRYTGGGELVVTSDINITGGRRVILMVPNADVRFEGNVNVDDGISFFMVISGQDIIIPPTLGGGVGPHLEGIYYAQNQFITESLGDDLDQLRLVIRGTVVGMTINGIYFQRDLDPANLAQNNTNTPAEFVEFAPDQIMMYPAFLGTKAIQWREVAP